MADDLTGEYMNSRGQQLTPADEILDRIKREQTIEKGDTSTADFLNATGALPIIDGEAAASAAKDVALGVIESPRQIVGGFLDATKELSQALESVVPLGTLGGDDVTEDSFITADEPRTTTGGVVRGVSQFLTGFIPVMRGMGAAGVTSKAAQVVGGGIAADAFAFDPLEDRLSNLVQSNPSLANPVTEYLAAQPDDTEAEGRFKNAIEGIGLGATAEVFTKAVKVLRASRIEKAAQTKIAADKEAAIKLSNNKDFVTTDAIDGEFIPFAEKAAKVSPEFKGGAGMAGDDAAANINLNNLESTDEVNALIEKVASVDAKPINAARRETITLKETEALADDLGMSVADLLDRRKGQAFNAEQAVAARKIQVASGESVFKLARKAASGSDEDVALFARALAQHRAIQAQVSGLTAEAGRALSSFSMRS